jgi:hypothetical protein
MIYLYFRIVWKLLPLARQGWLGPLDASREVQLNLAGVRGRGSSGPSVQHLDAVHGRLSVLPCLV